MSIYKMAAHKNIIIDGDYAYFVQRIGMMDLKKICLTVYPRTIWTV